MLFILRMAVGATGNHVDINSDFGGNGAFIRERKAQNLSYDFY